MGEDKAPGFGVAFNGYGVQRAGDRRRDVLAWDDVLRVVRTVEETGYRALFAPEIAAWEAFSTLAALAGATSTLRLATGVIRIDRRDPQVTALGAGTLDEVTGGRFTLGMGSNGAISQTRRFVEGLRSLMDGQGPVDGYGVDRRPGPGRVPIILAALGPRMTELAGEVADGALLNWCPPERVALAREEISRGAERVGRDPAEVSLAVYVRVCLEPDPQVAVEGLGAAATQYAGMPSYRLQLERLGLGREAEAASRGKPPLGLLKALCAWGSRDEVLERLGAYHQAGADLVLVYPVPVLEATSSILATVIGVAPRPAGAA